MCVHIYSNISHLKNHINLFLFFTTLLVKRLKNYYRNHTTAIQYSKMIKTITFYRKYEHKMTLCEASLPPSILSFKKRQHGAVFKHLLCSISCNPYRNGNRFYYIQFKKLDSLLVMPAQSFSASGNLLVLISLQVFSLSFYILQFQAFCTLLPLAGKILNFLIL